MAVLFEFEDQSWFPHRMRECMMDYLRFVLTAGNLYQPATAIIIEGLANTGQRHITDLCSGAGGAIEQVYNNLQKAGAKEVTITVTDKFPNIEAYQLLAVKTSGNVVGESNSVDAAKVPASLNGLRTMFSAFHHFNKQQSIAILQNAVDAKQGIAIFDGGDKNMLFMLAILVLQPISFILFTPFIKPYSWYRLLFTYLIPIIPFCTVWDGLISTLRLHSPATMLAFTKSLPPNNYIWKAAKMRNRFGMRIAYMLGYPGEEKDVRKT